MNQQVRFDQLPSTVCYVQKVQHVSVATMTKEERLQTGEVYTVGFVPSYDLPDKRPNSIDPFLEPLVSDIDNGFIEGKNFKFRCKYLLLVTV